MTYYYEPWCPIPPEELDEYEAEEEARLRDLRDDRRFEEIRNGD